MYHLPETAVLLPSSLRKTAQQITMSWYIDDSSCPKPVLGVGIDEKHQLNRSSDYFGDTVFKPNAGSQNSWRCAFQLL